MEEKRQDVVSRPTENKKSLASVTKANESNKTRFDLDNPRKGPGRPKGAKNKAKPLIPNELAMQMLLTLENTLPEDDMEYLRQVVREGKAVVTEREAKMMLAMLRANLLPVMVEEMQGEVIKDPDGNVLSVTHKFRSDVTDRLKVFISLLNSVAGIEKKNDKGTDNSEKPVFEVFARRGMDSGRLKVLIGYEHGDVGGDTDGTGRGASEIRAISDQLPERPLDISDSEEIEATWVLDVDSGGNDTPSDGEEEQGF